MKKSQLLSALSGAWELMLDFPQPGFLAKARSAARPAALTVYLCIPLIGVLCGAAAVILFKITGCVLTAFGNAFLFAVGMTALLISKDSCRGFRLLTELLRVLFSGKSPAETLPLLKVRPIQEMNDFIATLCGAAIFGFLFIAFSVIAYFRIMLWAVPVLLMGTAVQGHLLSLRNLRGGSPFLAVDRRDQNKLWGLTIFLMLFPAISQPLAILVAFGACYLLAIFIRHTAESLYGGITAELITLAGFLAELITLLAGILLIR